MRCRLLANKPLAVAFMAELAQGIKCANEAAAAHAAGAPMPSPPGGLPSWAAVKEAGLARLLAMIGRLFGVDKPGLPPLPCALLDVVLGPLMDAARSAEPFDNIGLITLRTAVQVRTRRAVNGLAPAAWAAPACAKPSSMASFAPPPPRPNP